ncbi:hypothetical protein LEP1GSC127_2688 [Leptospira kirschneri str. 200801925]|nr:hypothetical protein LEP1GSC127_2688 [Leptospira kirschneri str. 200801925]
MQGSVLDLAVPFFLILIVLEVLYSKIVRKKVYRWNDTVADLSTGILFSLTGICVTVFSLWVYEKFRIFCSLQTLFGFSEIPLGIPIWPDSVGWRFDFKSLAGWIFVFWLWILYITGFIGLHMKSIFSGPVTLLIILAKNLIFLSP